MSTTTLLTQPHFFKPLFPGFEDGLIIPAAFFKYFNGIKCEKAMLKSRQKGKLWPVKINGRQLGDGWKQFVQDHDLQIGDFLLFRHEGDLVFYVLVFGRTTCEREYPPFTSTEEEQVGIQEQNIPNDSSIDHPPFTSTEEEPIEIEEQNLPKDSSSGRPPFSAIEEEPIEIPKQNLPNNSEDEHIENQEQNLPKCSASGAGYPPFTSTEVEPIEIQEQNLPKCSVSGGEFGITEKVKRRLEPEDSCFVLEHPKCVIKLSPDSIRKNRLCVPFKFARESGLYPRSCSIIMKDEDANSWGAELLYNSLNRRFLVGAGWGVFHSVHKLKAGDSLMVELIKNWETPVFKIHKIQEHPEFTWEPTYRNDAQEDESIEIQEQNLPQCSIRGKNFGRKKKVKTRYETEASSFVLGRPKCVIELSPASIREDTLCIPLKFARESGLYRRTCSIILKDEDADFWSAKLSYRSSSNSFYIAAGWSDFQSAHKLKVGDSLMVELIKSGETPVFKLHKIEEQPEFTQAGFDLKKHQQNIPEVTEESEIEEQNLLKDSGSGNVCFFLLFVHLGIIPYFLILCVIDHAAAILR